MSSFLDLPDELILKVFSYTERADHWRCGRVSKRIRNISKDNALIPKVNFMDLPYEVILKVLTFTEIADILSFGQVSMDGFSRILEKKLSELLCTRL